jgi:Aspartyl protease
MAVMRSLRVIALLLGAAVNLGIAEAVPVDLTPPPTLLPLAIEAEQPTEIIIEAPEPRYVAPTRRDRIGRIWAPVYINDKGPFRMVLDTGASRSGVTASVATALGLAPDQAAPVMLQGATGALVVPTIRVDTLLVGDVLIKGSKLPILRDALGGAEGILGSEGLADRRVYIDFSHDLIIISRSHDQRAGAGFMTIPFTLEHGRLLIAQVQLGRVRAKAIIDTGSQSTVANLALRDALLSRHSREVPTVDELQGVTDDIQEGEGHSAPPIEFGPIEIHTQRMTFADAHIFQVWRLMHEPALLVGMDALGTLDTLIIDYRRHELQLRMREGR